MKDSKKNEAKNDKKDIPSSGELKNMTSFSARKHVYGALTWFVCLLLMAACFYETRIISMALMIPVLIIMAIGFYREGKHSLVRFDGEQLVMDDYKSFRKSNHTLDVAKIDRIKLDTSTEGKGEIIHSMTLDTGGNSIPVPDIDFKEALVEKLTSMNPKIKIKRI